ncbi:MAG: hypothetical protein HFG75_13610 [Hungatella sp.]|nr:hypothetical protein [Hungatella sp.]
MRKRRKMVSLAIAAAVALQTAVPATPGYAAMEERSYEASLETEHRQPDQGPRRPRTASSSDGDRDVTGLPETEGQGPSTPGNAQGGNSQMPPSMVMSEKAMKTSATGDLWDQWQGDMDFAGLGTRSEPYQIDSLAHLMGLSEAVAAGVDFKGSYFEMTQDIDAGGLKGAHGGWNPIGWYQNQEDMDGDVAHGFSGTFDGCGNTIRGLEIHRPGEAADYVGLFGLIDGGCVRNLKIEEAQIYGGDKVGVLAGAVTGGAVIYNVEVSGYVRAAQDAGGLVGTADGRGERVAIENCSACGIAVLSEGGSSYTGGLAGQAVDADLVDNRVETQDGSSDRIQGKGYTGGITGRMRRSNLYNSYVDGTVGGNGAKAVGGICGLYESGNLILARFAGDIGRTNNGSASREGTFIGMRQGTFTYGTEKGSNLSYLFTNTPGKARTVFGSGRDGDNTFTRYAHIGYWTDNETRYVTVAGVTETGGGERYFYEELEDGVRYIVTQKLGREFTAAGYGKGLDFKPDHFAPGYQGEPVRGYLLSVPRIDAANANGTYDTDVALLSALPAGVNTYYRIIDKDHSGAVAPGVTVSVATAAKNTGGNRYQMAADGREPSGVKPPTYLDETGEPIAMTYVNGGSYSFVMPSCDTEINADYVKVTTGITLAPSDMAIRVTQTRSGDRKNPEILTEVRDQSGILIARYLGGIQDTSVEVQPMRIHGEHNHTGSTADRTLKWSVDDSDLIHLTAAAGYTMEDAAVMPNLSGTFIQGVIDRETGRQADSGYEEAISSTVYRRTAVVTAASNPATTADRQPVYANCKVTVELQILDRTTRRVEGLSLNYSDVVCTITRTLRGDRKNPQETITCELPAVLAAGLTPKQPFYKNVTWKDREGGQILTLTPMGDHQENCRLTLRFDPAGEANPAWIQNVIQADNQRRREDPYRKLSGSAQHTETVTATAEDQTNGIVSASCNVTIRFVTEDRTRIVPEEIKTDPQKAEYHLSVIRTGDFRTPVLNYQGFDPMALRAEILPECPAEEDYQPYDRGVIWTSQEPEALTAESDGTVIPVKEADWIQKVIDAAAASKDKKAEETRTVSVKVFSKDGHREAVVEVILHMTAEDQTIRYGNSSGGSHGGSHSSGGSGSGSTGGPGVDGVFAENSLPIPRAGSPELSMKAVEGSWIQTVEGYWTFLTGDHVCRNEWVYIRNPYADAGKGQSACDWFYFNAQGQMVTGWFQDKDGRRYYLNPVSDNTKGRMMTGWNWIAGTDGIRRCYYFQEQSDGSRGAMFENRKTPDGYEVNQKGEWIMGNEVQVR